MKGSLNFFLLSQWLGKDGDEFKTLIAFADSRPAVAIWNNTHPTKRDKANPSTFEPVPQKRFSLWKERYWDFLECYYKHLVWVRRICTLLPFIYSKWSISYIHLDPCLIWVLLDLNCIPISWSHCSSGPSSHYCC